MKREKQFNLVLTNEEHERIKTAADKKDIGMNKYIRDKIFDEDLEMINLKAVLCVCRNNLKAISHLVKWLPKNTTNEQIKDEVSNLIKFLEDKK